MNCPAGLSRKGRPVRPGRMPPALIFFQLQIELTMVFLSLLRQRSATVQETRGPALSVRTEASVTEKDTHSPQEGSRKLKHTFQNFKFYRGSEEVEPTLKSCIWKEEMEWRARANFNRDTSLGLSSDRPGEQTSF